MSRSCLCDIFGVPVSYDESTRRKQWNDLLSKVNNLGLSNCVVSFVELNTFVLQGFLSPKSASYFLTGRCSLSQYIHLESFSSFWDSCVNNHILSSFKVFQLWQKQKNVVPENTFLFPLAELDFDSGFDTPESIDYFECASQLRDLFKD